MDSGFRRNEVGARDTGGARRLWFLLVRAVFGIGGGAAAFCVVGYAGVMFGGSYLRARLTRPSPFVR